VLIAHELMNHYFCVASLLYGDNCGWGVVVESNCHLLQSIF